MKTVEFKLSLNQSHQAKVDGWLHVQRWVWNRGLHLLEEFDSFSAWDKISKTWTPACRIPWSYYKDDSGLLIPFTRLAQTKPYRMSCPILQTFRQPELESPTYFGLRYYFAQKNHEDKPWFCEVPSKFVAGTLKALADAWQEYKAGKRKRPRYKRYKDKVKTLINNNSKYVKFSAKQITLPKLGKVTVKTLDKRWDESVPIATLKIIKEPSGYYLHLTGELPTKKFDSSNKGVGISLGCKDLFTTDSGKVVEPPAYYQKIEKRIAKLQKKLSRQQNLCPIATYNPNWGEHFLSCPINPLKGVNKAKTQQEIARQHEKLRRARRAFNHKLSTKLVREYGGIAIAKSEVQRITRRPKPIVNKQGTGYDHNGALLKSQFNKLLLANGLSQLTTLIKQKAAVHEREYIEVAPRNLPDELRQRTKHYSKRLRLPRAVHLSAFQPGTYRAWPWESTPGESPLTPNQEATQVAALCGAKTTSHSTWSPTNPYRLVDDLPLTPTLEASNQSESDLSVLAGCKRKRTTPKSLPKSDLESITISESNASRQPQKVKKIHAAPNNPKNESGSRKRQSVRGNDSS